MVMSRVAGMAGAGVLLVAGAAAQQPAPGTDAVRVKSDAIHARVLTLDTHVDMRSGDYGVLTPGQKVDLVKMQQGGIRARSSRSSSASGRPSMRPRIRPPTPPP